MSQPRVAVYIVGPNVRNYRLLLEEQRAQLSAMIDQITARNRKMGVTVHESVYQVIHQQSVQDEDAAYIHISRGTARRAAVA